MEIGVWVAKTTGANPFGYANATSSFDQQGQAKALAADLNRRGGLAGHPVQLVFAFYDSRSPQTYAVQDQAGCATFTQDHHVAAVLNPFVGMIGGLDDCLAQRHTPLLQASVYGHDAAWFGQAPGLRFSLEQPMWDRVVPALIDRLISRRLLTATSKSGVLVYDNPAGRRHVAKVWNPAMARRGLKPTEVAYLHSPTSTPDITVLANDLQGVVLKWKAEGIDTVFGEDTLDNLFELAASNQDYYPFYGLTSNSIPYVFGQSQTAAETERAAGIGWTTYYDTGKDGPHNSTYQWCEKVTAGSGGTNWADDAPGRAQALDACDLFAVLTAAVGRTGIVSARGIADGIAGLGTAVTSGLSFGLRFDPRHPDGVAGYRDITYSGSCTCVTYSGPLRPF